MSAHSAALLHHLRSLTCAPSDGELLRRWSVGRDEDAFAALVARHGRLVLGVCRRVLGNGHDAEDVFQATFLVLARKASSLRQPEALAGWLHGVAVRLARRARTVAARRRSVAPDASLAEPCDPAPEPLDLVSGRELLALIDREIARLPELYRLPVVLCDLEERTQPEAAHLLGWTPGSLRGRLLRGRERLRERLARRGLAPALLSALLASGLTRGKADAALASLVAGTSRLASCASAQVPAAVAALAREGLRGVLLGRLEVVSALLLLVASIAAGTGMLARQVQPPQAAPKRSDAPANPSKDSPPARCDASGDPLPKEAIARLGTTRFRHGGRIESLGFTPDGRTLVSTGKGFVRVWDAATGKLVRTPVTGALFGTVSPDGKLLAVRPQNPSMQDGSIEVRDLASGRLLHGFGDQQPPRELLFSPDGKVLAAYRWSKKIELWDPARGRLLHTLDGDKNTVWSIAFSADSKTLVSAGDDGTIRLWDVATGKVVRRIRHGEHVYLIAVSPDGKLIASVDATRQVAGLVTSWEPHNRVYLWDAATGKELRQLAPPARTPAPRVADRLMALAFAPDGKTLVTGGIDGMLRFWDPASGRQVRQVSGFFGSPTAITFAPDGKTLALGDAYAVRRIDVRTGKDVRSWPGHCHVLSSLSVSPDGHRAATSSYEGPVRIWSTKSGRLLREQPAGDPDSVSFGLVPGGLLRFLLEPGQRLRIQDLTTGKDLADFRAPISRCVLSSDRKLLAAVYLDNSFRLVDVASGKTRYTLSTGKDVPQGMAFSASGRTLAAWREDRVVTVWDVAGGKQMRQFSIPLVEGAPTPPDLVASLAALSPDGRLMAFALQVHGPRPGAIPVVDTATGREVRRFRMTASAVSALAFSADGKSLAYSDSAGWNDSSPGRIHVGEIVTGRRRHSFPGHAARISALVFSANGKTLLSAAEDTTALVWDLTGRWSAPAKESKPLSSDDVKAHWKTLAGDDAAAAYRAIQALAADPRRTLPFLEQQLRPVPVSTPDQNRFEQWVADLDSSDFAVRERASRELDRRGQAALPALRKALADQPSLEVRRRLDQLLRKHEPQAWVLTAEQVRDSRAVEVLERIGAAQAQRLLAALAAGRPDAWLTRQAQAAADRLSKRSANLP